MKKPEFCNKLIEKKLVDMGATNACHRCSENEFVVLDEMTHYPLQPDISGKLKSKATLPVALVICTNCGAVTPHALGAFDLIPNEEGDE
ncbi:hypothetical protein [Aliivibrio sifiae]|uniref:Uncharacterized protein n=1 Tax=Aliivibrio sifiae TaxID=566293 RepID=A0A2S7X8F5_9GAMM|nr:hypothetical protein [Aliivibrio sifiae]PQJ87426.1 hypothetical protein BTO23_15040 [Aliivibrio sifiae]GLR77210.1 hypothetical protein GCM10007855_40850 [Aliivibrio sifiae]